jgi:hypothetical protein
LVYTFRNTFVSPEDVVAQTVSCPIFSFVFELFYFLNNLRLSQFDITYIFLTMFHVQIVIQKDSPRGVHFRRAGPREKVLNMEISVNL